MNTIPEFVKYFEEKVYQIDESRIGMATGKEPEFPLLVFLCGKDAQTGFKATAQNLYKVWPQYKKELLFVGVDEKDGLVEYKQFTFNGDVQETRVISKNEIGDLISWLFDSECHFRKREKLLIYYVMDSESIGDMESFLHWLEIVDNIRSAIDISDENKLELMFLLLKEEIIRSKGIAPNIKEYLGSETADIKTPILLLSNYRSDGVILQDRTAMYKIIAGVIAITDNSEIDLTGQVFHKGIYTASYAFEEKPVSDIAQVVINKLMDRLSGFGFDQVSSKISRENLGDKIGLSSDRTLLITDEYASEFLFKKLPTIEQLELFPRRDKSVCDCFSISADEFNALTMNSWECYLNSIVSKVYKDIEENAAQREKWHVDFYHMLQEKCTIDDIVWLKNHKDDVRSVLAEAKQPSQVSAVLAEAKERMRYMLSTSEVIVETFLDVVDDLGNSAEQFKNEWKELVNSRFSIHESEDASIVDYYSQKAINFLDRNENEFRNDFRNLMDGKGLDNLFRRSIDKIIDSEGIFTDTFENEIGSRLESSNSQINTQQYIRQKLTGVDVPTYFRIRFSLGTPIISAIMLNSNTTLFSSLKNHLPDDTYYYPTGSSNSAQAIKIFKIEKDNLM